MKIGLLLLICAVHYTLPMNIKKDSTPDAEQKSVQQQCTYFYILPETTFTHLQKFLGDNDFNSLLFQKIKEGKLLEVQALIAIGADPNARNKQNFTPLMFTATYNNFAMTQFLLAHGADPTLEGPRGDTAYALAKQVHSQPVLELLPPDNKKKQESDDDSDGCRLY